MAVQNEGETIVVRWLLQRAPSGVRVGVSVLATAALSSLLAFPATGRETPVELETRTAEPAEPSQEEVLRQARFREDIGMGRPAGEIERMIRNPRAYQAVEALGLFVTPPELRELRVRFDMQHKLGPLRAYGSERVEEFADLYIDHEAGGVVRVGFTTDADSHLALLRARFPYPDRVEVFTARHSLATLSAVQSEIMNARAGRDPVTEGTYVTEIDVIRNAVVVRVDDADARRDALQARFGADRLIVETGAPVRLWADAPTPFALRGGLAMEDSRRDTLTYGSPLRGGLILRDYVPPQLSLQDQYRNVCTSGFVAHQSSTTYWLVTAAHCYPIGANVYQGDQSDATGIRYRKLNPVNPDRWNMGTASGSVQRSSQSDIAAVQIPSALKSNYLYVHPSDHARRITYMQLTSQDAIGDMVCIAGQFNPGAVTAEQCARIAARDAAADHGTWQVTNMRSVPFGCKEGDSGAGVYSAGVARGLLHGGTVSNDDRDSEDAGETCYYTHIDRAVRDIGLTGLVTS